MANQNSSNIESRCKDLGFMGFSKYKVSADGKLMAECTRAGKITSSQAEEIKIRVAAGERMCDLAKEFKVSSCSISNIVAGRVWSGANQYKEIKGGRDKNGYIKYTLRNEHTGKREGWKLHQLVLLAFVGPCPDGCVARHFPDPNPENNRLENLSWGTHLENQHDRRAHGTSPKITCAKGEKAGASKLNEKQVLRIRRLHASGCFYLYELAAMFGVDKANIHAIVHRRTWIHI